jgi:hypothetical protein
MSKRAIVEPRYGAPKISSSGLISVLDQMSHLAVSSRQDGELRAAQFESFVFRHEFDGKIRFHAILPARARGRPEELNSALRSLPSALRASPRRPGNMLRWA